MGSRLAALSWTLAKNPSGLAGTGYSLKGLESSGCLKETKNVVHKEKKNSIKVYHFSMNLCLVVIHV